MHAFSLLSPAQVDLARGRLFRVSAAAVATIAIVVGAIVGACIWIGWRGGVVLAGHGAIPALLAWWVVFWLGLFFLFYANDWRKTLAPGAWLALAADDGVYVKYRSYRNASWSKDDLQVVFVPYRAIASARIDKRTWLTPETRTRDTRSERVTYVELELPDADLDELQQRLADERASKPGRSASGASKTWQHFPVSVEPGNVMRIEWRARPGAAAFVACLAAHGVHIGTAAATNVDLRKAPSEEQMRELARRGQTIELVHVLRYHSEMTLVQAKTEAERLIAEAQQATDDRDWKR